jgi:NDP-sugar pyrophosphorylase family protein
MKAVILAGGLGTRLRSVVNDRPKPMAPVAGRPFLEYLVERARLSGCEEVILAVGYRHDQIEAHFGDGTKFGVAIRYAVEETPLGTGGALKNAAARAKATFLVMNGDTFCDVDLRALLTAHAANRAAAPDCLGTLALVPAAETRAFGQVALDTQGRIVAFHEKTGSFALSSAPLVSAGVYAMEPEILARIPDRRVPVSLEAEVFPAIAEETGALFGEAFAGFFIDIGTPEGYQSFERFVTESLKW